MTTKQNFAIRVLKWTGIVLSLLLILVLLATWLINREPFQGRIRQAVSERAGNMLTSKQLRIALLPRPHLVLNNAVISVPETISGSVESAAVYPEFLQLLRGKVRVATVHMEAPDIVIKLSEEPGAEAAEDPAAVFTETRTELEAVMTRVRKAAPEFRGQVSRGKLKIVREDSAVAEMSDINALVGLAPRGFNIRMDADTVKWGQISAKGGFLVLKHGFRMADVSVSGGRSSISGLSARFSWRQRPYLQITSGQAAIALEDVYDRRALFGGLKDLLQGVKTMKGTVTFTEATFRGPLLRPERWKLQAAGTLEGILFHGGLLPRPLGVESGRFTATANSLAFTGLRGSFLDSPLTASATISGSMKGMQSLDLSLQGVVRAETMRWAQKMFGPSPWLALRTPFTLADLRIGWEKGALSLAGRAAVKNGPAFSIDLDRSPGKLRINRLTVEDGTKGAVLALTSTKDILDATFKGNLDEETLTKILERPRGQFGWIRGDVQARLRFDRPEESTAFGKLEGADLVLPYGPPVFIRHLNLQANRRVLTVNSGLFEWAGVRVNAKGAVTASEEGFALDLDADAGSVNLDSIRQMLSPEKAEKTETIGAKKRTQDKTLGMGKIPLRGVVRFFATDFKYGRYTLKPFRADVLFRPDTIRLKLLTATLCGVSLGGTIQPFGPAVQFDLVPVAVPQQLEPVLQCFGRTTRITGEFNMHSFLGAKAPSGKLMRSLYGHFEFYARDGKIFRYPLLSRIFAFLNVTELLRGKLPDMGRDGFAYKSIRIKGDILNGKLKLKEALLEGATLNLAAEGEIDLAAETINVTVLVAPFKTIEYVLNKIPIIRNILANRLITVPVRVRGDLNNPEVTPLAADAIGRNLLDIMKRTLALPFKVLDPLLGRDKEKTSDKD